jgi:hypothetical protein
MAGGAPDTKAMEEAMMKAATPGPQHKVLGKSVGDWTFTNKLWMGPGEPMVSDGTMHAEWALGGRYVQSVYKGSLGGMPFEGRGTDGYDNVAKEYVGSWVDNMGTGIMTSTGTCDEAGKVCTYNAEMSDPMAGGKGTSKMVLTYGEGTFKLEMFMKDPSSGTEMKTMELVASRRGAVKGAT